MHNSKPVFTAQFHPEAKGGPTDTEVINLLHHKEPERNTEVKVSFRNQP